jgi:hypothetical protein
MEGSWMRTEFAFSIEKWRMQNEIWPDAHEARIRACSTHPAFQRNVRRTWRPFVSPKIGELSKIYERVNVK